MRLGGEGETWGQRKGKEIQRNKDWGYWGKLEGWGMTRKGLRGTKWEA